MRLLNIVAVFIFILLVIFISWSSFNTCSCVSVDSEVYCRCNVRYTIAIHVLLWLGIVMLVVVGWHDDGCDGAQRIDV